MIINNAQLSYGFDISRIYGITKHPQTEEYAIVMRGYLEYGDLRTYLQKHHSTIDWKQKTSMLYWVASSLYQVHSQNVVHCDLHSGNVLLQNKYYALISDFGLSKAINDSSVTAAQRGSYGIIPYMAPELLRGATHTKATDIYAFGIIMWEMSALEPPFNNCDHDASLMIKICKGTRPAIVPGTPDCWVHLMQRCWDADPAKRPSAEEVWKIVHQWYGYSEEIEKADEYCRKHPRQPPNGRHPGAVYKSRFIPSIGNTCQNEDCGYVDDDEWEKDVVSLS
jgi:serine/threonine protein kinase